MTMSAFADAPAGVSATAHPVSDASASALARVRLKTVHRETGFGEIARHTAPHQPQTDEADARLAFCVAHQPFLPGRGRCRRCRGRGCRRCRGWCATRGSAARRRRVTAAAVTTTPEATVVDGFAIPDVQRPLCRKDDRVGSLGIGDKRGQHGVIGGVLSPGCPGRESPRHRRSIFGLAICARKSGRSDSRFRATSGRMDSNDGSGLLSVATALAASAT